MRTREYFPGGNTPQGFYSYYDYILPASKANYNVILKGGPGTGKSSLMKKVAALLNQHGYETELLHCSSDPDSLDAVVCQALGFSITDGTAPHIVDPRIPGAADCIINLGDYWDADGIRNHRGEISELTTKISESFSAAYDYLKAASAVQGYIRKTEAKTVNEAAVSAALCSIIEKLELKDLAVARGSVRKGFLSAITPKGNINYIDSFAASADRVLCVESICDASLFTNQLARKIVTGGKDAYIFYCPMQPDAKTEHIYLPKENIFITTANDFHKPTHATDYISLNSCFSPPSELRADKEIFNRLLARATDCIRAAKQLHDRLEGFYVPYMNFAAMEALPQKLLSKVL